MERKRCTGCGADLPAEAFAWRDRSAGRRYARCRPCQNAYKREWYRRNEATVRERVRKGRQERLLRNARIADTAKAVPCADCGRRYGPEEMDFDHVRGDKRFNISDGRRHVAEGVLRDEIAKCEVVCAVCHRLRTTQRARSS